MKFRTNNLGEVGINSVIENMYKETHNLRFGAEVKLGNLALRGGYATYQNPYKYNINDVFWIQKADEMGVKAFNKSIKDLIIE